MNLNQNPTADQLRNLIRQGDDRAGHHVLSVTQAGDVRLSMVPKNQDPTTLQHVPPDVKVRYEPFPAGLEYVGPDAAADDEWVTELFASLLREWQRARRKAGVEYVELESVKQEA